MSLGEDDLFLMGCVYKEGTWLEQLCRFRQKKSGFWASCSFLDFFSSDDMNIRISSLQRFIVVFKTLTSSQNTCNEVSREL